MVQEVSKWETLVPETMGQKTDQGGHEGHETKDGD